jgi:hypothetical protein
MKTFSNWLQEDRDPADKSEGHKRATLLASYIDDNDLLAGLMGQPTKSVVYRFLAIVQSLPAHEKLQFEKQIQELQMNAMMAQQGNAEQEPQEKQ